MYTTAPSKRANESFVYYVGQVKTGEKRKLFSLIPIPPSRDVRNLCWVYPVLLEQGGAKVLHGKANDLAIAQVAAPRSAT